jgi:hypothetical protein
MKRLFTIALIACCVLFCAQVQALEVDWTKQLLARSNYELGVPSAPADSACSAIEYLPTADTKTDQWTKAGGTYFYENVDEAVGAESNADYVIWYDGGQDPSGGSGDLILRYTLPGNCNATTVRVYFMGSAQGDTAYFNISASADNSSYTSPTRTLITSDTPQYIDISVTWTTPAYAYIKFTPERTYSYHSRAIFQEAIKVNP